jgi:ornithine cyclodeaminase/alanine dehydrogenase-like protein (mu-crystallin family)
MTLYLSNDDVRNLLPMSECIELTERVFRDEAAGRAINLPRTHLPLDQGMHRTVFGIAHGFGVYGMKTYGSDRRPNAPNRTRYLVMLYDLELGGLEAIVEARDLGQIRTGAASGVATKFMAREDASTIGIIGSGWEARAQIAAMNEVRSISHVKAYSRSAEKREAFAAEMREVHGLDVDAVDTAEECVRNVDILITITGSDEPVLEGSWIAPGTHINGIGATGLNRRELDVDSVSRANLVVVENMEQARADCGELIYAEARGGFDWAKAVELSAIITGEASGRPSNDAITLFDALGVGTEDLAAAAVVLKKAKEQGIGAELPL